MGCYKINVDGSADPSSENIAAGGVLRDCRADWMEGFTVNLGKGRIIEGELWAIYHGLELGIRNGCRRVIIESDSREALRLVEGRTRNWYLDGIVEAIKEKSTGFHMVTFKEVFREQNQVADLLSKEGVNFKVYTSLSSYPTCSRLCKISF